MVILPIVEMVLRTFVLNMVGTVTRKSMCIVVLWAQFTVWLKATALLEWEMLGTSVSTRLTLKTSVLP